MVGKDADRFHRWVAGELQRYLRQLSGGEFPVVGSDEAPADALRIALGGPDANPLAAAAQRRHLADFTALKPDGFILKAVEPAGRPTILVGGNDEAGTMYAAYDLLERLGIVFQLTNDVIPQRRPDLALTSLDARVEPVLKYRGMHCCHGLRWHMGLDDFRKHIDQMAKLKLNCLQFYAGMGSPWVEFSYGGKKAEIIYSKESGYLAWTFGLSTSGTAKDVRVGRECFRREYIGPPEFAAVRTPEQAFATAREFLREIIRYAHRRKVQVWLMQGEVPYVPPNLAPAGAKSLHDQYCGVGIPPDDPAVLGIWESALRSAIETYPEADAHGVWTSEPPLGVDDPKTRELLRQNEAARRQIPSLAEIRRGGYVQPSRPEHLASDLAQVCVAAKLIESVKKSHPRAKLGVVVLFRSYLFRALDSVLPKDVWLMSMENWNNSGPVMHFYGGIAGRDLLVMPRIDDDGCELHVQLNATMYDRDEIISGSAKYGLAGVVGQLNKERGLECNVRYIAEGAWNPQIQCRPFYESYLRRLYGAEALEPLLRAYLTLEENDRACGRRSIFPGYSSFSPAELRKANYKEPKPRVDVRQLEGDIAGLSDSRKFWNGRAAQCREALELLRQARPKVLPGARAELDYVIFKTESFISYFEVLDACDEARAAFDRALLAKSKQDNTAVLKHLEACQAAMDRADRLSADAARQMVAYCSVPTEKYLLFRYNQNVIGSIERNRKFLAEVVAFHKE